MEDTKEWEESIWQTFAGLAVGRDYEACMEYVASVRSLGQGAFADKMVEYLRELPLSVFLIESPIKV